jgi:hypothetical protein
LRNDKQVNPWELSCTITISGKLVISSVLLPQIPTKFCWIIQNLTQKESDAHTITGFNIQVEYFYPCWLRKAFKKTAWGCRHRNICEENLLAVHLQLIH